MEITEEKDKGKKEEKTIEPNLMTLDNLDDVDFVLGRYAQYRTARTQMRKAWEISEREGIDVRDTFHVVGLKPNAEDKARGTLLISTSGEEGEKYAADVLSKIKQYKSIDVVNESTERFDKDKHRESLLDDMLKWLGIKREKKELEEEKS